MLNDLAALLNTFDYGHGQFDQMYKSFETTSQIVTCLVLFTRKELLNDWFQLGTKVFAVEPTFEKNLGTAADKIPVVKITLMMMTLMVMKIM